MWWPFRSKADDPGKRLYMFDQDREETIEAVDRAVALILAGDLEGAEKIVRYGVSIFEVPRLVVYLAARMHEASRKADTPRKPYGYPPSTKDNDE